MEDATLSGTVIASRLSSESDSALRKAKRQKFKPEFVQIPMHWVEALEQNPNGNTYRLALRILAEAFQRERIGGEIVLSAEMTSMSRTVRHRAAEKLEQLGLIKLGRLGKHAFRVILI